jgi:transcriptional regulator with XRE-family HTH domain
VATKTVAELVDDLFRTRRRSDGREYTYMDVAVKLNGAVEPSHLSKIRNGKITNPGRDTLLALCRFFEVSPTYFFPELDLPLDKPAEPEDPLQVALRSTGLQPEVQKKLEELIKAMQQG